MSLRVEVALLVATVTAWALWVRFVNGRRARG